MVKLTRDPPTPPPKPQPEPVAWENFNALVDWAAWHVVQGLLRGTPLRSLIWDVVNGARMATFKK